MFQNNIHDDALWNIYACNRSENFISCTLWLSSPLLMWKSHKANLIKSKVNMAEYVVDELALIADLFSDVPAECSEIFRLVRLQTIDLLTIDEENFERRLSIIPHSLNAAQLWESVSNWRVRNVSSLEKNCLLFYNPFIFLTESSWRLYCQPRQHCRSANNGCWNFPGDETRAWTIRLAWPVLGSGKLQTGPIRSNLRKGNTGGGFSKAGGHNNDPWNCWMAGRWRGYCGRKPIRSGTDGPSDSGNRPDQGTRALDRANKLVWPVLGSDELQTGTVESKLEEAVARTGNWFFGLAQSNRFQKPLICGKARGHYSGSWNVCMAGRRRCCDRKPSRTGTDGSRKSAPW